MKLEELKQVCDAAIPILPQGIPLNYLEACVKHAPELVRRLMRLRELLSEEVLAMIADTVGLSGREYEDIMLHKDLRELIHKELPG